MKKILTLVIITKSLACTSQIVDSLKTTGTGHGYWGIGISLSNPEISAFKSKRKYILPGIGAELYYSLKNKKDVFSVGVNYEKNNFNTYIPLYLKNTGIVDNYVNTSLRKNTTSVSFGYMHYFKGNFIDKGFKFYGMAGIEWQLTSLNFSDPVFDNTLYYTTHHNQNYVFKNMYYLGLGVEQSIGKKSSINAQLKYRSDAPFSFTLGYRFKF